MREQIDVAPNLFSIVEKCLEIQKETLNIKCVVVFITNELKEILIEVFCTYRIFDTNMDLEPQKNTAVVTHAKL